MPMSWQLCCLPAAKQSFANQVRSQTEFGNEEGEQDASDGNAVLIRLEAQR